MFKELKSFDPTGTVIYSEELAAIPPWSGRLAVAQWVMRWPVDHFAVSGSNPD